MKERFEKIKEWASDNSEAIIAFTYAGALTAGSCYIGYVFGRLTSICEVQKAIIEVLSKDQ